MYRMTCFLPDSSQTHSPSTHDASAEHWLLQRPQCASLSIRSSQKPSPQSRRAVYSKPSDCEIEMISHIWQSKEWCTSRFGQVGITALREGRGVEDELCYAAGRLLQDGTHLGPRRYTSLRCILPRMSIENCISHNSCCHP